MRNYKFSHQNFSKACQKSFHVPTRTPPTEVLLLKLSKGLLTWLSNTCQKPGKLFFFNKTASHHQCPPTTPQVATITGTDVLITTTLQPPQQWRSWKYPIQTLSPLSTTLQEKSFQTRQLKILQKKGLYHIFTALWVFFLGLSDRLPYHLMQFITVPDQIRYKNNFRPTILFYQVYL